MVARVASHEHVLDDVWDELGYGFDATAHPQNLAIKAVGLSCVHDRNADVAEATRASTEFAMHSPARPKWPMPVYSRTVEDFKRHTGGLFYPQKVQNAAPRC